MPAAVDSVFIRKPRRRYPLPQDIYELDYPWPEEIDNRYARVDRFREGYAVNSGDNPMIILPGGSKSKLLSKM